jgi:hypothetical protein
MNLPDLTTLSSWDVLALAARAAIILASLTFLSILWRTRRDPDLPKELHLLRLPLGGASLVILGGNMFAIGSYPQLTPEVVVVLAVAFIVLLASIGWAYLHFSKGKT